MKNSLRSVIVLYDGACPACSAEMRLLRSWDRADALRLEDISVPSFRAEDWGFPMAALSTELHVRGADGAWLKGMAAIRYLYRFLGRGSMLAFTGWPLLAPVFDAMYRCFARNRLGISRFLGLTPDPRSCGDRCSPM